MSYIEPKCLLKAKNWIQNVWNPQGGNLGAEFCCNSQCMHMQLQISVFWHLVITEYFQQQYYWYYIVSVSKCIRIWDALRSEIMSQNDKVPSWDQWVVGYILCSMYKCIYCGGLLFSFFYLFHIKSHQISPFTMLNF